MNEQLHALAAKLTGITQLQAVIKVLPRTLFLLCLTLPTSAWADFDNITVNGEAIDQLEFEGYKTNTLPERYCYPSTDELVIQRVIGRRLLIEEGKRIGVPIPNQQALNSGINEQPNDSNSEEINALAAFMINAAASYESQFYADYFLEQSMPDIKAHYLDLLAKNDPLVVNVNMVRTAKLSFQHRYQAEEVLERLKTGETFDGIAAELGRDGNYYERKKEWWQHAASLPPLKGNIEAGTLFNTWFRGSEWQVRQVLEIKNAPVLLLKDEVDDAYSRLQYGLKKLTEKEQLRDLIARLWEAADVKVDGKALAFGSEAHCGFPAFLGDPS